MRFSRVELVFIAFGAGVGALAGLVFNAGWLPVSAAFPPFVFVLLGLALGEIAASLAAGRPPGSFVAMPARIAAFALGLGVLMLLRGGLG